MMSAPILVHDIERLIVRRLRSMRSIFCCVVSAVAVLVLIGWVLGSHRLQSIGPGMISMKVNTAFGLILLSIAIYGIDRPAAGWRGLVWTCLALVACLTAGTLLEYLAGIDLRIDDVLFHDAVSPRFPGRMAPATAVVMLSLAAAGAMLQTARAIGLAQAILAIVAAAPLTTLGGYLYRAPALYAAAPYPVIALHTSIALMLLCVAALFTYPERALMHIVTQGTLAGSMARRLLPASVCVPLIVGLCVLAGERTGLYSIAFGSALLVACCGMFFAAVVWWTTALLARSELSSVRVERALALAQRRSESALLAGEVGTFDWDVAGDRVYGDANFARLFGITRDEDGAFPIADYLSVIHAHDRVAVTEKISRAVEKDEPFEAEYRIVHPDRRERWIVARGRVERGDDRSPVRFPGVIVDITDRKRAEADREQLLKTLEDERKAIESSERRRRLALDAAELGSWNLDATTLSLASDPRFRAIFGITDTACTFQDAFAAIHHEDREMVRAAVEASMQPGDSVPYATEYRVVHPDGSIHWVFAKGRAALGGPEGDQVLSLDGTVAEITDRKSAEADLAFQQHQLELIFRASPAALALWRGEELIFERVNPQYQDLFPGRTLVGRRLLDACPELRGQGFDELLLNVLRTGKPFVGREALARIASGEGKPAEDRYFDFSFLQVKDSDGRPWGVYDHAVDVTDRVVARQSLEGSEAQLKVALSEREKVLEAERSARAEVEFAGRMKDEFLATLSHELRTPLSAILGWSQILSRGTSKPEVLMEGLRTIERNARAQTQIIDDLLDMSRIISGKVVLDMQRIDLSSVLRAGIDTVKATASAKQVGIVFDSASTARYPILGDLNRLQQVIWNLLSNAIKFTPRGGIVEVRVEQRHSMWQVDVVDTGEGISGEFLPYVFDRFRQADASTTRKHGGLGLGLAIVKQLVELHGGKVRVKSEGVGKGAVFTASLPISVLHDTRAPLADVSGDSDPAAPPPTFSPAAAGVDWDAKLCSEIRGAKILVVDDEPDARALLKRLLEDCGCVVSVAENAQRALESLQQDPPDVLISDIGMPGEDGYELLRRVREHDRLHGRTTPAVALTAYARTEDRVKATRAGFEKHVPKPIEPVELVTMIASLVRR